jgi:hypothetical protein
MPRTLNPEAADFLSSQGPPSNEKNGNRNFRVTHVADGTPDLNPLEYNGVSSRHITPSYIIRTPNGIRPDVDDVEISAQDGTSETMEPPFIRTAHGFYFNTINACY